VWRWLVPLVAAGAGLLFVTTATAARGTDLRGERLTQLADLIRLQQDRLSTSTEQVQALQSEVNALVADANDPETVQLSAEVARLEPVAGLRDARGPGLTVTLEDAPVPPEGIPAEYGPDDYVVHQQDVQAVVNALWAGGAAAVSVMDERLVTTGAVRCVGNTLILHGRVYAPPYRVTAVGEVDRLRRSLEEDPDVSAFRRWVGLVGLGYGVDEERMVTVPGYDGTIGLQFAEPVT
jgi:uncharacterized protein YlxW (UPF0749 family)